MDETGMLDYFYGNEAEQFEFLQVPMILVKDPIYHQGKTALNSDAILLYSFMLNRAKLSRKNGWLDEHNRVFIRYAQKEAEEDLHRKKDAVIEAFRKLENVVPGGLIERREVIKGKPYLIYVKNFRRRIENEAFSSYRKVSDIGKTDSKKLITDVDNFFQNSEKPSTTGRIIRLGQVGKTDPRNIYLKNNNTEKDITSIQSVTTGRDTRGQKDDANDMTDEYISLIKKNIGYPEMCDTLGSLEGQIYLNGFSENVRDIIEKFKFDGHISTMANKGILYIVLKEFTTERANLHPNEISNLEMGYIFEEIIRRFSEAHNEDAGQHYTPREVIQLMVNILFYDDNSILSGNNVAKTIYDPACGTGGIVPIPRVFP